MGWGWPDRDGECQWMAGLASLRGMVQQKRDLAWVDCWLVRSYGQGPAEQRWCRAVQPDGHGLVEILWVLITGLAGLGARSGRDRVGLKGGSWGSVAPTGLRSGPKDQRSCSLQSSGSMGLWGGTWCASPAILLVYPGMEKPSMS
jgi:hypothetical protein